MKQMIEYGKLILVMLIQKLQQKLIKTHLESQIYLTSLQQWTLHMI